MIQTLRPLFLSFLFLHLAAGAQLRLSTNVLDLGQVGAVYELAGDIVVTNDGESRVHILRASADEGLRVYTSKRTLQPGDTALLVISYQPQSAGKFSKKVTLMTTDEAGQHRLLVSGEVERVKQNDHTACYYFGSRARRTPRSQVAFVDTPVARHPPSAPVHNIERPLATSQRTPEPPRRKDPEPSPSLPQGALHGNRPNNIILLLDISSSMRDSLKLPLMKAELHRLVDAIRDVDSVSLVTYADTVKVRAEALSGSEREKLHAIVDGLKARGMTKGKKAILFSQQLSQKHFVQDGNNLLILASDGKFNFTREDQEVWNSRQSSKPVTITTVAFGDDREAVRTLRQIAHKGDGSFIHITSRRAGNDRLLEEVRERSAPAEKR